MRVPAPLLLAGEVLSGLLAATFLVFDALGVPSQVRGTEAGVDWQWPALAAFLVFWIFVYLQRYRQYGEIRELKDPHKERHRQSLAEYMTSVQESRHLAGVMEMQADAVREILRQSCLAHYPQLSELLEAIDSLRGRVVSSFLRISKRAENEAQSFPDNDGAKSIFLAEARQWTESGTRYIGEDAHMFPDMNGQAWKFGGFPLSHWGKGKAMPDSIEAAGLEERVRAVLEHLIDWAEVKEHGQLLKEIKEREDDFKRTWAAAKVNIDHTLTGKCLYCPQ